MQWKMTDDADGEIRPFDAGGRRRSMHAAGSVSGRRSRWVVHAQPSC